MTGKLPLIALTGGTGFVGLYVIRYALDAGYSVRALIRNPARKPDLTHPNLTWHQGALGESDADFVKGAQIVVHIAGLIKARRRDDYFAVNDRAAGALALAAEKAGVDRFVLLSSMAARVPGLSDYAGSKAAGEKSVKAAYKGSLAIVRAPAVFGPGDEATAPFFTAIKRGLLPVPGGHGWRKRRLSMVFVEDLARDLVGQALSGAYDGDIISPATIVDVNWPEFADICSDVMGRPVRALAVPISVLYLIAGGTSVASRILGVGHLTLGKLREFLYQDWSSKHPIQDATPIKQALDMTMRSYAKRG